MSIHYPDIDTLTVQKLSIIKTLLDNDPNCLTYDECPYDYKIQTQLEDLLKKPNTGFDPNTGTFDIDVDASELADIDFEQEAKILFYKMKNFQRTLNSSDTTEQVQTFRTIVSLIEKMIEAQERASGMKQFAAFSTLVMDSMERYLTPVQKSEFLESIQATLHTEV